MHYKNGRAAKVGDVIVAKTYNGLPASKLLWLYCPRPTLATFARFPRRKGRSRERRRNACM